MTAVLPPLDGSLTLTPGFVDFHAEHNADLPWAVFPARHDPSAIESVSYAQLAAASHRIAHLVRPQRQGPEGAVVALLTHCDALLYASLFHGFSRAGVVPFPISPRISPEAIANLLQTTNCHRLISQPMFKPLVNAALGKITAKDYVVQVDDLWSIWDVFPTLKPGTPETSTVEHYPARSTPIDLDEPAAILHSSGSTGLPKAVYQTHRIELQWGSSNFCMENRKRRLRWAAGGLPTLHAMGFTMQVIDPLATGNAFAIFAPTEPAPAVIPTADRVLELAKQTQCSAIPTVPTFIEGWAQSEESVKFLASLATIGFAGGPLSSQTGIKLVKAGVSVQSMYGSTEGGVTSGSFDYDDSQGPDAPWKTSMDFEWMQFPPPVKTGFVPQGDGTYEMQFLTCETHQPAVENLTDVKGYATSDLFEAHPTKKGLWRVVGRQDDVIVLGTGEKIVPIPQESHITSSPYIIGALMFGREKMQAGVLLEPHPSHTIDPSNESELIAFRNKVWPVIAEANAIAPTFAKIYKEMILVADPARPFPRAPKGTAIRKPALALYTDDIENLYKAVAESSEATGVAAPSSWTPEAVQAWLLEQAVALHEGVSQDVSRDLFEQGYDSLSATFLRNRLIHALRASTEPNVKEAARLVSQNFIFDYPTIRQLTDAVSALIHPGPGTGTREKTRVEHTSETVAQYTADLPQAQGTEPVTERVVLLTGSTGNIGSHVLAALLAEKSVEKVYTLDRAEGGASPKERLRASFEQRGLPVAALDGSKLVVLAGDLKTPQFGLEKVVYDELKASVSHVVHNAWTVNFNVGLYALEHHVVGTRKLVEFCASVPHAVHLLFASSMAVAGRWDPSSGPVPETELEDVAVAVANGYAASKYVAEQILARAADKGLKTTSLRIGQVTGSAATGAWNTSDWVPILVKSSLAIGALPELSGSVSWIPVDAVAGVVLDLVTSQDGSASRTINVMHPKPVAWNDVIKLVNDAMGGSLPVVPYAEWLKKVEALDASQPQSLNDVPALKLLEFFRSLKDVQGGAPTEAGGLPVFATAELLKKSGTARALSSLNSEHAQAWVRYWKERQFLV